MSWRTGDEHHFNYITLFSVHWHTWCFVVYSIPQKVGSCLHIECKQKEGWKGRVNTRWLGTNASTRSLALFGKGVKLSKCHWRELSKVSGAWPLSSPPLFGCHSLGVTLQGLWSYSQGGHHWGIDGRSTFCWHFARELDEVFQPWSSHLLISHWRQPSE